MTSYDRVTEVMWISKDHHRKVSCGLSILLVFVLTFTILLFFSLFSFCLLVNVFLVLLVLKVLLLITILLLFGLSLSLFSGGVTVRRLGVLRCAVRAAVAGLGLFRLNLLLLGRS